MNSAEVLWS